MPRAYADAGGQGGEVRSQKPADQQGSASPFQGRIGEHDFGIVQEQRKYLGRLGISCYLAWRRIALTMRNLIAQSRSSLIALAKSSVTSSSFTSSGRTRVEFQLRFSVLEA